MKIEKLEKIINSLNSDGRKLKLRKSFVAFRYWVEENYSPDKPFICSIIVDSDNNIINIINGRFSDNYLKEFLENIIKLENL